LSGWEIKIAPPLAEQVQPMKAVFETETAGREREQILEEELRMADNAGWWMDEKDPEQHAKSPANRIILSGGDQALSESRSAAKSGELFQLLIEVTHSPDLDIGQTTNPVITSGELHTS
jgi:hypothetical protein